jgi:hypothetical protein
MSNLVGRLIKERKIPVSAITGFGNLDADDVLVEAGTNNTIGKILLIHRSEFADGASANNDIVLTYASRILDVFAIKTDGAGNAGNTVQLQTAGGAANVTDAFDMDVVDTTVVRALTIDDAQRNFANGATLRIRRVTTGGNSAVEVYVLVLRV